MKPGEIADISKRTRNIEGWFQESASALFGLLDELQRSASPAIGGGLFEIGVHHGKSAALLCAMARSDETVGVCDLFDSQGANVSGSGAGVRAIFEANVSRVVPGFDRLRIHAKPSGELASDEIGHPQRIFHIDGGHLREEALADLQRGADVLDDAGAIVIDDPYRSEWPGVTEGLLDFLTGRPDFVPIFLGFNKLVIVRSDARAVYRQILDEDGLFWQYFDRRIYSTKVLPVVGAPTRIAFIPSWRQRPELEARISKVLDLRRTVASRLRR